MTLLPEILLDSNDDYIESLRNYFYPKLHPWLVRFTPAYGTSIVGERGFACTVGAGEELIEMELVELGFLRNPVAAYKVHPDGRMSEGSWVLLPENDDFDLLDDEDRQLHVTLFPRPTGKKGRSLYAHEEYDWRDRPWAHLRGEDIDTHEAAEEVRRLFEKETYFEL